MISNNPFTLHFLPLSTFYHHYIRRNNPSFIKLSTVSYVDSLDWKDYDATTIIKKVTEHKHLGNGSIILCHNGAKHTAEALDQMITVLKQKGYTLVPISALIMKDGYTINHEGRQVSSSTTTTD